MCVFIYTLRQLCGHKQFQNIAECNTARGLPLSPPSSPPSASEGDRGRPQLQARPHPMLASTVFLFDTARDTSRVPESYTQRFSCKKRRAVRPTLTFCDDCVRDRRTKKDAQEEKPENSQGLGLRRSEEKDAFLAVPGVVGSGSSGSSVGMVATSGSTSDMGTSGKFPSCCAVSHERSRTWQM